jgi:hypothetical protein
VVVSRCLYKGKKERGVGCGLTMPLEGGKRKGIEEEVVSRCLSKGKKEEKDEKGKGKKSLNEISYFIYYYYY